MDIAIPAQKNECGVRSVVIWYRPIWRVCKLCSEIWYGYGQLWRDRIDAFLQIVFHMSQNIEIGTQNDEYKIVNAYLILNVKNLQEKKTNERTTRATMTKIKRRGDKTW